MSSSAFSSNDGPAISDNMLSPNTCCLQLAPGALVDRSCIGGRPGMVAITVLALNMHIFEGRKLTRIHSYLLNCCHGTKFGNANFSTAD